MMNYVQASQELHKALFLETVVGKLMEFSFLLSLKLLCGKTKYNDESISYSGSRNVKSVS